MTMRVLRTMLILVAGVMSFFLRSETASAQDVYLGNQPWPCDRAVTIPVHNSSYTFTARWTATTISAPMPVNVFYETTGPLTSADGRATWTNPRFYGYCNMDTWRTPTGGSRYLYNIDVLSLHGEVSSNADPGGGGGGLCPDEVIDDSDNGGNPDEDCSHTGGGGGTGGQGGGNGGAGGSTTLCSEYVQEVSYDNGQSWTVVDSWWECN